VNLKRMLAMTWARTIEFVRDRSALSWNLIVPIIMVAGIGWIFSGPGRPMFKVAVIADVPIAAELHPFLATTQIQFYPEEDPQAAILKVQRHRVDMLLDLRQTPGRYWINEQSPKGQVLEKLIAASEGPRLARQTASGADIRYVDWLVPGVLGMNMMFSCLFGIGYVIVRYRKSGYLKRLNATPLTALEFILAQLISRLVLILLLTIAVFAGTNTFLHFRMEGAYLDLFLVTLLGCVSMIAMGLVISARVTSEELAGGLLNVLSWPMMVLSGVFFSIDGAPQILQKAAEFFPLTHLLNAARAIMLDGAKLAELAYPMTVLAVMAVAFLALGASIFRWRQE
jgi:ABC-2 type transport system permease protein